jgi:hypothetical protein
VLHQDAQQTQRLRLHVDRPAVDRQQIAVEPQLEAAEAYGGRRRLWIQAG